MANTLSELNSVLHTQLQRLNTQDINGEMLAKEIERTKAISSVSKEILGTARIVLEAELKRADLREDVPLPQMLK